MSNNTEQKKKSKKTLVLILIAVLVIAALALGLYIVNKSDGSCDLVWGMGTEQASVELVRDLNASRLSGSDIYEMNRVPGMIKADTMILLYFTESDELYQVQMMTGIGDYSGADLQKKIMKYLKKHFGENYEEVAINEDLSYKVWKQEDIVVTYSNGSSIFFYNPKADTEEVKSSNIKYGIVEADSETVTE